MLNKLGEVHFRLLGTNDDQVNQGIKDLLLRARVVVRSSNMKFTSLFDSLRQNIAPKSVLHVRLDDFSVFIQPIKSLICGDVVAVVKS